MVYKHISRSLYLKILHDSNYVQAKISLNLKENPITSGYSILCLQKGVLFFVVPMIDFLEITGRTDL